MRNFHGKSSGSIKELEEVLLYDTERDIVDWRIENEPCQFRLRPLDEDVASWLQYKGDGFRARFVEWKLRENSDGWWEKFAILIRGNQKEMTCCDEHVVAWGSSRRDLSLNVWKNPLKTYGDFPDGANTIDLDRFAAVVLNAARRVVGVTERPVLEAEYDDFHLTERYDLLNARGRWCSPDPWKLGLAGLANFDAAVFDLIAQWARMGIVKVGAKGIVVDKSI